MPSPGTAPLSLPRDVATALDDPSGASFWQSGGSIAVHAVDPDGRSPGDLAALAAERAPGGFGDDVPFFWRATISTDRVDTYFTRMMRSSLDNYAADAAEGRAFLNSHTWNELPIGYSLTGTSKRGSGDEPVKTASADFYTIRDYNPTGRVNSNEVIRGMQRGLIRDVSIGWLGGNVLCSICKRDMWGDWDCMHLPGFEYSPRGPDGEPTDQKVMALGLIEDAHLAEVSAVFEGATPGALITKVYREVESRRVSPNSIGLVESRYRMRIPDPAVRVAVIGKESAPMPETRVQPPVEPPPVDVAERALRFLRDTFHDRGIVVDATRVFDHLDDIATEVRAAREALVRHRAADAETIPEAFERLSARINALAPQAEDGKKYRQAEVERAVKSAVRAFGSDTDAAEYENMLADQPIERVVKLGEQWEASARLAFPGGRQTTDTDPPAGEGGAASFEVRPPAYIHSA